MFHCLRQHCMDSGMLHHIYSLQCLMTVLSHAQCSDLYTLFASLPIAGHDPLDFSIRDADIANVAGNLALHMIVAGRLGIPQEVIDDIEEKYGTTKQREAVLRKWITKKRGSATYRVLYDELMELGERGAAETILDIAKAAVHST